MTYLHILGKPTKSEVTINFGIFMGFFFSFIVYAFFGYLVAWLGVLGVIAVLPFSLLEKFIDFEHKREKCFLP